MFESYKFIVREAWGERGIALDFPTEQEDLVSDVISNFNGRVEKPLEIIKKVLSGEIGETITGLNDRYFIVRKDITTAGDDLASLNNESLEEGEKPEIEEVDIPTLRLKEILEDYIVEKEKLGIK